MDGMGWKPLPWAPLCGANKTKNTMQLSLLLVWSPASMGLAFGAVFKPDVGLLGRRPSDSGQHWPVFQVTWVWILAWALRPWTLDQSWCTLDLGPKTLNLPGRVLDRGPLCCLPVANSGQTSEVGWGWPLETGTALDLQFEALSSAPLQLGNGQTQARLPNTLKHQIALPILYFRTKLISYF